MDLRRIKLRNKIVILCAALVMLTTAVIQASSWWSTNRFNQEQLRQQVDKAKAVLAQYLSAQESLLVTAAKVLTADFGFIRAVATSDSDTIKSVLKNHGVRINADVMALTDMSGHVQNSTTDNMSLDNQLSDAAIAVLIANPAKAFFVSLNQKLYQLILIPVKAPHVIAYSIVGFEIDQKTISDLESLTGLDISFFQGNNHLLSSTIRMDGVEAFQQRLKAERSSWFLIDRPAFLTETMTLESATANPVKVMLISSLEPLYRQYDEILLNNTGLAIVVALLASLISMIFARTLTVPLRKLAYLARDYARGDYLKHIEIHGGQEISNLKSAFRDMGREIKQREDEISYQARHDLLTGLYNLYTVKEKLADFMKPGRQFILVAINIHNFRQINDRLGSDIADACLVAFAERLLNMQSVKIEFSGRLDGVEFFSLLQLQSSASPIQVVDMFLTELEYDFRVSGLSIKLDLNTGISLYPENGTQAATMLRRTVIALDTARSDKQRIHCYEDGEDEAHMQRLAMMEALRRVILTGGDGQLFMMYQPKIRLNGEYEMKAEALIRWRRDNDKYVSPEVFVNLAEEASLIVDLTHWVFDAVLTQLQQWHYQGMPISVAINVSAQDLAHPQFEEFVTRSCDRNGVLPKYITLEITERDIMHDEASVVMSLRSLKKLGFSISIDDYGIGQSSLSKLKGLPVDEIKLDKSFIMQLDQSPKDQLIVQSTIELAHGLGFEVVAEGVENRESLDILCQLQCDQVQGYFISKPLAADAIKDWQKNNVEENPYSDRFDRTWTR